MLNHSTAKFVDDENFYYLGTDDNNYSLSLGNTKAYDKNFDGVIDSKDLYKLSNYSPLNLNLNSGWNMVGILENMESFEKFSDSEIIWKWDNNKHSWSGWSPKYNNLNKMLISNKIEPISYLKNGDAVWIKTNKNFVLTENYSYINNNLYSLKNGWSFISIYEPISVNNLLKKYNGSIIWKWNSESSKWKVWTNQDSLKPILKKYIENGIFENLYQLKIGDGCWIFK
jgi:hypothetical protein